MKAKVTFLASRDAEAPRHVEEEFEIGDRPPLELVTTTRLETDLELIVVERFKLVRVRTHDDKGGEQLQVTYVLTGTEFE